MVFIVGIIILAVVVALVLKAGGVGDSIAGLIITSILALTGGGAVGGVASLFATPVVGLPVGIFIAFLIFTRLLRRA